jgi:tyrosine-protein kinase Etk/Wzc
MMNQETTSTAADSGEPDDGIDFWDLLIGLGEEKGFVLLVTGAFAAIGLAIALLTTPIFTGRTLIMPPQQSQGASAALSASLGALAGAAGLGGAVKSTDELYVALMRSDAVALNLSEKLKLKDRYEVETQDDVKKRLNGLVRIAVDKKSSLISVEADDKDPKFAAELANAYVSELRLLTGRLAITEAQQKRAFFEAQMAKAKDELVKAELAVKQSQERGGLVSVDAQTQSTIGAAAQLRAQVVSKEVQIQAARSYAGPENPELRRMLSELASLKNQLEKLEGGSGGNRTVDTSASTDSLSNVRIYRELKYQEAIFGAMVQQFQLARVEESKDAPLIQQVDVARPPERKSKPSRALILILATFAGLSLGILVAFLRRAIRKTMATPPGATRMKDFARAWSFRKA